jgi:hypothetical protein
MPATGLIMSATDYDTVASDEPAALEAPRRTRIDPPHAPASNGPSASEEPASEQSLEAEIVNPFIAADASPAMLEVEEPTDEMIAAVSGENLELRREQLQLQVAQLAGHLRERLREVDRREASVNARIAQLESDLRSARLWLRERELAFQERETELLRQIEELQERAVPAAASSDGEIDLIGIDLIDNEARLAEIAERERDLGLKEDDLRERRFEFDRQAAALGHAQQVWQQQHEREEQQLRQDREQMNRDLHELVAQHEQQLRTAELLVAEQAKELDQERSALAQERRSWEEQRARQRQAIDELRSSAESEAADRRTRLQARQEWIERQKAGLDQVRDEALRLHRQSLEMRLLAEQLWSQINRALMPADAAQAVAQLRLKLAEQYRVEEEQLAARQEELIELSEKIAGQHRELTQLKGGIREWATARQAEIEQQAATLVERELALDAQQEEFRQAQQSWTADRRRYEQQIRDLTMQLRTLPTAA